MKELITALKPSYRWLARELENDGNDNRAYANLQNNNNQDDLPETGSKYLVSNPSNYFH